MMWEGSRGNSQNLRNFLHTSPGGWVGSQPPFVFDGLITRFHWCSSWPKCSADSTRFSDLPTLWSVLDPFAICPFVSVSAQLIARNERLDG